MLLLPHPLANAFALSLMLLLPHQHSLVDSLTSLPLPFPPLYSSCPLAPLLTPLPPSQCPHPLTNTLSPLLMPLPPCLHFSLPHPSWPHSLIHAPPLVPCSCHCLCYPACSCLCLITNPFPLIHTAPLVPFLPPLLWSSSLCPLANNIAITLLMPLPMPLPCCLAFTAALLSPTCCLCPSLVAASSPHLFCHSCPLILHLS
jgi:hypothetical protein